MLDDFTYACEDWEEIVIALPEASSTYLIAFRGKSNNADGVYVDDVWVGNISGVGVEEQPMLVATVSPNPTRDNVIIEANASEGEVTIFDLFGRKIISSSLCKGHADIDLSNCAKGVYVAQISSEVGTTTIKLVKE